MITKNDEGENQMLSNETFQLIKAAANEDEAAFEKLFAKYYPIVRKFHREYYINGCDKEDLDQEARIVLFRTACRFEPARKCSFGTFYRHNLRNRVVDMIRVNNAQKRIPTEPLTSIEANEYLYSTTVADNSASNPVDSAIMSEAFRKLYSSCSPLEKRAFDMMMSGNGYQDLDPKAQRGIINAFERCWRKFDGEIN
ncbi:sigma-70 family RNA polymerase sigma factor [Lentilactobacillus otakiensis DSM 19908 = JCM 15040]|nr:sigma-70 family RNA polymerase sigma factor [Lentilactobacillus otakiensis DSM 19908 = JCM 15040]